MAFITYLGIMLRSGWSSWPLGLTITLIWTLSKPEKMNKWILSANLPWKHKLQRSLSGVSVVRTVLHPLQFFPRLEGGAARCPFPPFSTVLSVTDNKNKPPLL